MAVKGKPKGKPTKKAARPALKDRHQAFVEQYFLCNFNGTKAARAAGFEGDDRTLAVTASRLLRNAKVRAAIDKRMKALTMSADEVLARITDLAKADLADVITIVDEEDEDGTVKQYARLDLAKAIENHKSHLLKKVAFKKDGVEFELHNSLEALRDLGRYHKLFADRVVLDDWRKQAEQSGYDPDDLKKQVAAALASAKPKR